MTDQRTRVASAHVDAVLAAHQPAPGEETPQCVMCGTPGESPVPWPCTTHEHAARARAALTAALAELDAVIAADPDHGGHYPDCHLDHATCLAARVRAHLTRKETTMPNPTTVRESDPELLELLGDAGRRWGPLGVALAAASLTDREALARKLTTAATPAAAEYGLHSDEMPDLDEFRRETLPAFRAAMGGEPGE